MMLRRVGARRMLGITVLAMLALSAFVSADDKPKAKRMAAKQGATRDQERKSGCIRYFVGKQ